MALPSRDQAGGNGGEDSDGERAVVAGEEERQRQHGEGILDDALAKAREFHRTLTGEQGDRFATSVARAVASIQEGYTARKAQHEKAPIALGVMPAQRDFQKPSRNKHRKQTAVTGLTLAEEEEKKRKRDREAKAREDKARRTDEAIQKADANEDDGFIPIDDMLPSTEPPKKKPRLQATAKLKASTTKRKKLIQSKPAVPESLPPPSSAPASTRAGRSSNPTAKVLTLQQEEESKAKAKVQRKEKAARRERDVQEAQIDDDVWIDEQATEAARREAFN